MTVFKTHASVTRLRKEPNAESEMVGELPKDTPIEILEQGANFTRIAAIHPEQGELTGYVHNSFISEGLPPAPQASRPHVEVRCQGCGNSEWIITPLYQQQPGAHRGATVVYLGFMSVLYVKARVCLSCGLVQQCLDEEALERLREAKL